MKEEFLHFIWLYKLLPMHAIETIEGSAIEIIKTGTHNHNQGPDFLNACLKINGILWNGNIEIHINSSHWDAHQHSDSKDYKNIILHIVYQHDKPIDFIEKNNIPTLELQPYINANLFLKYREMDKSKEKIPCASLLDKTMQSFDYISFYETLNIEKLELNYHKIMQLYEANNSDWEATLFQRIAYVFGLKINADIFQSIAQDFDFKIIKKIANKPFSLQALLLGKAGLLHSITGTYQEKLKKEYDFLNHKYNLNDTPIHPNFLRLRPPNFPTIKLSQLANLYAEYQNLFSFVIGLNSYQKWMHLFKNIKADIYWNNHYVFGKTSPRIIEKKLSKANIDLLIINAIIPIQFAYQKSIGKTNEDALELLKEIATEKNSIIENYKQLNFPISSAFDTQALLNLNKNYCIAKKCLNCKLGFQLLKK